MPDLVSGWQIYISKFKTNNLMKKAFTILSFLVFNHFCEAQSDFEQNTTLENLVNGRFMGSKKYTDIEGSPYFPTQWVSGTVTLKAGKVISLPLLRLNTMNGSIEFQANDKPYDVVNSVSEFTLGSMMFKNGFEPIGGNDSETFYEVIYDGKNKLLCKHESTIRTEQPYNSASKISTFVSKETYFLSKNNGKMYEVKKNVKNFSMALNKQTSQIEEYCKKENIKLKSWNDAVKVLEYADSLERQ